HDWVRQEIRHALAIGKKILPVMLSGFEFPKRLPDDIKEVTRYNGVRFHMDFFDSVIEKIEEKLSAQTKTVVEKAVYKEDVASEPPKNNLTDDVKFKIYLYLSPGWVSDIILYSPASSVNDIAKYDFTEEEWKSFARMVKRVIAVLFNTGEDMVAVTRKTPVGIKECAPCDGSYFDEQYRVRFDINYISESSQKHFETVHFTIENDGVVNISLFRNGDYIFNYVDENTELSSLGIDEDSLMEAAKPLAMFAEHSSGIIFGKKFESKVYSDKSGGYNLKYLVTE
ncbi:MAG: hypothetical protein IJW21_02500, partial [Clostridia bacterium]|nr:hypothetical protein [Clostridia bacterium]